MEFPLIDAKYRSDAFKYVKGVTEVYDALLKKAGGTEQLLKLMREAGLLAEEEQTAVEAAAATAAAARVETPAAAATTVAGGVTETAAPELSPEKTGMTKPDNLGDAMRLALEQFASGKFAGQSSTKANPSTLPPGKDKEAGRA